VDVESKAILGPDKGGACGSTVDIHLAIIAL
jgi:hypothetical protein